MLSTSFSAETNAAVWSLYKSPCHSVASPGWWVLSPLYLVSSVCVDVESLVREIGKGGRSIPPYRSAISTLTCPTRAPEALVCLPRIACFFGTMVSHRQ